MTHPHVDFNPAQHPRGPGGRFTRSFARPATPSQKHRGQQVMDHFSPVKGSPLAGMSGDKAHTQGFLANASRLNDTLRAGGAETPDITALHSAMKPLPHDLLLHRTVPLSAFGNVKPSALTGFAVRDAGFFPTSVTPQASPGSVLMRIQAPAGTPAVADPDTGDVVLDHGVDMLVDQVRDTADGPEMALTVLPSGPQSAGDSPGPPPAGSPAPQPPAERAQPGAPTPPQRPAPADTPPPAEPAPAAEPVPVPDSARAYHRTGDGLADLIDTVNSPVTERRSLTPGLVGTVERVTHEDGTDEFHKINGEFDGYTPEEVTDAEQLAALVGQAIGADVPRVYRTGPAEIHTDWAEGVLGQQYIDDHGPESLARLADTNAARRIGLMDMLVGNSDRHAGNFLVSEDGSRITGIDHGFAWSSEHTGMGDPDMTDEDFVALAHFNASGSPFTGGYVNQIVLERSRGNQRDVQENHLSPEDIATIRPRLEALRPEFDHLGRGAWLDQSLRILDAIGAYAGGTESILHD